MLLIRKLSASRGEIFTSNVYISSAEEAVFTVLGCEQEQGEADDLVDQTAQSASPGMDATRPGHQPLTL